MSRSSEKGTGENEWKQLYYDLHIHSCLSPCGDDDMTPGNIVGMAALKGLDVIAVTDHGSCKNCPAVLEMAEMFGIVAIPGMELTTEEEVHVVCLFPDLESAMDFDQYVYRRLLDVKNREDIFGKQQILNGQDEEIGRVDKLLIGAADISFDQVYELVEEERGGVMIPAHLDKSSTSLLSNLGFIPEDSRFKNAELKSLGRLHELKRMHPYLEQCRILSNSDAHYLGDIHEPVLTLQAKERSAGKVVEALRRPI